MLIIIRLWIGQVLYNSRYVLCTTPSTPLCSMLSLKLLRRPRLCGNALMSRNLPPPTTWSALSAISTLLRRTGGLQNLERAHQRIVNSHHGPSVVEFTAVIRCRENRHQFSPGKELISIFNYLMRSYDKIELVASQKLAHDIPTECKRDSSIVFPPSLANLICEPFVVKNQIANVP